MRKYKFLVIPLVVFTTIFIACSKENTMDSNIISKQEENSTGTKEESKEEATIKNYFPFKENTIMDYQGIGNEFAEQTVFFEYIDGNRAQMKIFNPGTVVAKVLEYSEGELREIYSEGEFYHIDNLLNVNSEESTTILKEPLKPGNSWTIPEGYKRFIRNLDVELELPYGKVEAMEVVTQMGDNVEVLDYYVKDLGHVASIYKDGDFQVETLLEKVKNSPYELELGLYYPINNNIKTVYTSQKLVFNTNDNILNILEDKFKNPPSNKLNRIMGENTKIKSIKLERGNGIVRLDLSKEFIPEINAGSSLEYEILRSITNTLGDFYGVNKVYITIEGEPYASGHFQLEENDYFEINKEGIEEFKE